MHRIRHIIRIHFFFNTQHTPNIPSILTWLFGTKRITHCMYPSSKPKIGHYPKLNSTVLSSRKTTVESTMGESVLCARCGLETLKIHTLYNPLANKLIKIKVKKPGGSFRHELFDEILRECSVHKNCRRRNGVSKRPVILCNIRIILATRSYIIQSLYTTTLRGFRRMFSWCNSYRNRSCSSRELTLYIYTINQTYVVV